MKDFDDDLSERLLSAGRCRDVKDEREKSKRRRFL